ncbi:hypothetical protein B0A48_06474 [Cryoendolithus antarcticus]|uniref:Ig-like domain-containing protein n=1 Tax=Cryoendolithus antarcticus TaxID=1507870 RepID=A0A1V8TBE6_9PEZI|nr:hypothetical protein B0A48_06474 [Cryoendolithus antarcticus]
MALCNALILLLAALVSAEDASTPTTTLTIVSGASVTPGFTPSSTFPSSTSTSSTISTTSTSTILTFNWLHPAYPGHDQAFAASIIGNCSSTTTAAIACTSDSDPSNTACDESAPAITYTFAPSALMYGSSASASGTAVLEAASCTYLPSSPATAMMQSSATCVITAQVVEGTSTSRTSSEVGYGLTTAVVEVTAGVAGGNGACGGGAKKGSAGSVESTRWVVVAVPGLLGAALLL